MPLKKSRRIRKNRKIRKNKQVKKIVNRALASRGLAHPEIKYHYTAILTGQQVTTTIYDTGYFLQPVTQGDDADNMPASTQVIGLKYTAKYLDIYGHIFNTSTSSNHSLRMILVRDDQPFAGNGLVPYSATANYNQILFQFPYEFSEFHSYKPRRFKVLWDRVICLGASSQDKAQKVFRKRVNLYNTQISNTLNVGAANNMSPQNHQYILFLINDQSTDQPIYATIKTKFAYQDV